MKKFLFVFLFIYSTSLYSQNLQLHYDFGKSRDRNATDRGYFTSTFEMYKPDKLGSTFWFIDMDYSNTQKQIGLAYMEFARNFKIGKFPVQPHVEFNGGVYFHNKVTPLSGGSISNAWLFGGALPLTLGKGSIEFQLMYKAITYATKADGQFTVVWFYPLFNGKVAFDGFLDFWSEDKFDHSEKKFVLLTEPQVWYTLNKTFAIGSEVEISHNFIFMSKKTEIYPTLAMKWNF